MLSRIIKVTNKHVHGMGGDQKRQNPCIDSMQRKKCWLNGREVRDQWRDVPPEQGE